MNLLAQTAHRPWPIPPGPWIMEQVWRDLLFAHWDLDPALLRPLVPECLDLDTREGKAWLSITPFHMSIRFRGLPVLPGMRAIPELNCRTYVVANGKPGVCFFSLDTTSRAAVLGARLLYHLPYFYAQMRVRTKGSQVCYMSKRGDAVWRADYAPIAPVRNAAPGSLEQWLCERYCLYSVRRDRVYRGEIHHVPWPLQDASIQLHENTVAKTVSPDIACGNPALVSFARELKVLIWPPQRIAVV